MDAASNTMLDPSIARVLLPLDGLDCARGRGPDLVQALTETRGVRYAYVNSATEMAYVVFDPRLVGQDQLSAVIARTADTCSSACAPRHVGKGTYS